MSERLQGKKFKEKRPLLKMVSWEESLNGHIRVNLVNKFSGKKYHHWLNSEEQEKFEISKHLFKKSDSNNKKTHSAHSIKIK